MKKLIYTILAVSIIFISCKKDEEEDKASIVGAWSPKSIDIELSVKVNIEELDSSYTVLPGDEEFIEVLEFIEVMEFTADGKLIAGSDTGSYTYSGNVLTTTLDEEQTWECVVTATSLKMTSEESDEWVEEEYSYDEESGEWVAVEYSNSIYSKMTINAERK